jgi:hypothetical protein
VRPDALTRLGAALLLLALALLLLASDSSTAQNAAHKPGSGVSHASPTPSSGTLPIRVVAGRHGAPLSRSA